MRKQKWAPVHASAQTCAQGRSPSAEAQSVDVGDTESVAMISYAGEAGDVTIRIRWQDLGGRPLIVHTERAE